MDLTDDERSLPEIDGYEEQSLRLIERHDGSRSPMKSAGWRGTSTPCSLRSSQHSNARLLDSLR